jgi:hypothetical protein
MTVNDHVTLLTQPIAQIPAVPYRGRTACLGPGRLQVNLAILDGASADDVHR